MSVWFKHIVWMGCLAGLAGLVGWEAAHAQDEPVPLALTPKKAITQYVHRVWTQADGLPQNAIGAVTQTHEGYLWVGTQEGLARFDGARFTAYDARNTDVLTAPIIARVLYEDRGQQLWVGTEEHGLYRYANGAFTRHAEAEGLTGQRISSILQDRRGRLWVGTQDRGLFVRSDSTFRPHPVSDSLGISVVSALHEARDGTLWVGTDRGAFVMRPDAPAPRLRRLDDALPDSFVTALHEDPNGRMWIGTRAGLARQTGDAGSLIEVGGGLERSMILSLTSDRSGAVWAGTDYNGLFRYANGRVERFAQAHGLSHNRVTALHVDREGSLWVGTEAGGLNQLYNGKFTAYGTHEGLSSDRALAVYEASDHSLWVGTDGDGVNRLHEGEVTSYTRADGLSGAVVTSLGEDAQGAVWVGTYGGGLNRFRDGAFTARTTDSGLPSDNVFALQGRRAGGLWVGTDAGLALVRDARIRTFTAREGLPSNSISALHEDRHGTLWVGTYDAGLGRSDGQRFVSVAGEARLGSNRVLALHEDADGVLWVGTYGGGLVRMDGDDLTRYTTEHGLPDDRIYQILEDRRRHLWVSSNRGVVRLSKDELYAVAHGDASAVHPTLFPSGRGALGEVSGGVHPAGWAGHDGRLWFPTNRGVVALDPEHMPVNAVPPHPIIEQVRIDDERVAAGSRIPVAPGTESVQFQFTAPSFVAPEQVQFRYQLDGFNKEWHTASSRRTATYTNLDPGTYTFRVQAANSDSVWSPAEAAVTIVQEPHFYQTDWFYLLGLVLLGGGLYGGYRVRLRHLKRREQRLEAIVQRRTEDLRAEKEKTERALTATEQARQETEQAKAVIEAQADQLQELDAVKTQFFNNLSHEFRTPLTLTVGPLENVLTGSTDAVSDAVREPLQVALRNARRLLRLVNQILDFSKLDSGKMTLHAVQRNLVSFVEGVVFSFSAFAQERAIDLHFDSACETAEVYYDPEKLERVLFNLLSNAIKFTPGGGRIAVAVAPRTDDRGDGWVDIHVQDSGPGIPEADQPSIFNRFRQVNGANSAVQEGTGIGLSLAKELVELHGGRIRVESAVGEGTTFVVSLRRGREHLAEDEVAPDVHGDSVPSGRRFVEMVAADASPWATPTPASASEDVQEGAPVILVVDDNADLRDYVRRCLEPTYRIVEARDGAVGLERARAVDPDLILSDVMMPGMDGHALCQAVKDDPALRHIPVIMLTAKTSTDTKLESLQQGADEYVAKPFNAEELRARIRNLLALRAHERALKAMNQELEAKVEAQVQARMDERAAYEAQLRAEKERAETAAKMKSAILNNMSHELRTPMASILGYAQLLADETPPHNEEFAQYIIQSGERLMSTLNDVLELSRLEAKVAGSTSAEVNVGAVVKEVLDEYAPQATRKGLDLERAIPEEALHVPLDAKALARVVGIVVDNAIKFTSEGHVRVEVARIDHGVAVRVEDTGIGIAEDFRSELFEPFHQERMENDREYGGEGLGLSIAKRLVDSAGGTIQVESTKGVGTRFSIRFPAAEGEGAPS